MFRKLLRWLIPIVMSAGLCLQPLSYAAMNEIHRTDTHVEILSWNSFSTGDGMNFRIMTADPNLESVKIVINNPGGSVNVLTDMIYAIQDLKARGVHITTEVTAMSLSAGGFIWLLGDERIVHKNSALLFHRASLYMGDTKIPCENYGPDACWGLAQSNELLESIVDGVITNPKVKDYLFNNDDQYINGQAAYDLGLATEIK